MLTICVCVCVRVRVRVLLGFVLQVCKRKCSEVQRCSPCKQPRCAFPGPDGGLENGLGVSSGGGEASSDAGTGHCHLPHCPLPSSPACSSSSSSSPPDGCGGVPLHSDSSQSSDSACCQRHHEDGPAKAADAVEALRINHLPSSILLKVRGRHTHNRVIRCVLLAKTTLLLASIGR